MTRGLRCPLCRRHDPVAFGRHQTRDFWRCETCALVFVAPADYPDADAERARYDQHRNDPDDPRYRAFLRTLAAPLLERLDAGASGLDFGCGPGPALAQMLRDAGHRVDLYDVFYVPEESVWSRRYDFVTATEVVEHLHRPKAELSRLFGVLDSGGWLAVMTKWVSSIPALDGSRYVRDPTHVALYSPDTCRWIAEHWNATVEFPVADVALFRVR